MKRSIFPNRTTPAQFDLMSFTYCFISPSSPPSYRADVVTDHFRLINPREDCRKLMGPIAKHEPLIHPSTHARRTMTTTRAPNLFTRLQIWQTYVSAITYPYSVIYGNYLSSCTISMSPYYGFSTMYFYILASYIHHYP